MKSEKHRRTQSNSEIDLKLALNQQISSQKENSVKSNHCQIPSAQVTAEVLLHQHNLNNKLYIVEQLDEVEIGVQKAEIGLNFGVKKTSGLSEISNNQQLFQIPEQNDLITSTQQSEDDLNQKKKLFLKNKKKCESKENVPFNQMTLLEQLRKINLSNKQLSFTNELQKKTFKKAITPERTQLQQAKKEKSPSNTFKKQNKENVDLNGYQNLFKKKKSQAELSTEEKKSDKVDYKRFEQKLLNIESQLLKLKEKQTTIESVNNNLSKQISNIIDDGKKQKEFKFSEISYQKLEELEIIAKRNEECLTYIKQHFMRIYKRPDQPDPYKGFNQTLLQKFRK